MKLAESCSPEVLSLINELWGVAIEGYLMTPPGEMKPESPAALRHIDKRLREGGFLPTTVKFVDKP